MANAQEDAALYAALIEAAGTVCEEIAADRRPTGNPLADRVWTAARAFASRTGTAPDESALRPADGRAPFRALRKLRADWPALRDGRLTGEAAFARDAGLWDSLMREPPMGRYAEQTAAFVNERARPGQTIVELGAGVGITSSLLRLPDGVRYFRTDLNPLLLRRADLPGIPRRYNFDEPPPFQDVDLAFAVNALHCAADPARTLAHLRSMLRPGGWLVFAEGSDRSDDNGLPSVMDVVFSQFTGWYDRGGFRSRDEWLADLNTAGFADLGHQPYVVGEHVLGDLFWARH